MANWITLENVTVGDSTKASSYNNLRSDVDNIKSDVFVKTKDGDQTNVSQDASIMREFTCAAASGALFNLLSGNGDTTGQVMRGWSHNFPISAAGAFGGRDETEPCSMIVLTEKGLFQRYSEPSSNSPYTAGGTPTFVCDGPTFGSLFGGTSAGSANAQTLDTYIPAYYTWLTITFKAGYSCTAATTMNVRGLGTKTIKNQSGLDLATSDIIVGGVYAIVYDGANFRLMNPSITATLTAAVIGSTASNTIRQMGASIKVMAASPGTGATATWTGGTGGAVGSNIAPTPAAGGSGYAVGDVVVINTGTNGAFMEVLTLSGSAIATWKLLCGGSGYGATGTGIGISTVSYVRITALQSTANGWGWNISSTQGNSLGGSCPTSNGSASGGFQLAVSSVGSGATAISYSVPDTAAKTIKILTSETITSVICIQSILSATTPVGQPNLFMSMLTSGAMLIAQSAANTAGTAPFNTLNCVAWTSVLPTGAAFPVAITYIVGGTA